MSNDVESIVRGLSEAQRDMVLRPNGCYVDNLADVGKLLELEIWAIGSGRMFDRVRQHLLSEAGEEG